MTFPFAGDFALPVSQALMSILDLNVGCNK